MLQIDLPTALWHVLHVKTEKLVLSASAPSSANDTYTETCVAYCLLDMIRNELRPGPLALSVVVESALRMKLLPDTVASPRL